MPRARCAKPSSGRPRAPRPRSGRPGAPIAADEPARGAGWERPGCASWSPPRLPHAGISRPGQCRPTRLPCSARRRAAGSGQKHAHVARQRPDCSETSTFPASALGVLLMGLTSRSGCWRLTQSPPWPVAFQRSRSPSRCAGAGKQLGLPRTPSVGAGEDLPAAGWCQDPTGDVDRSIAVHLPSLVAQPETAECTEFHHLPGREAPRDRPDNRVYELRCLAVRQP